MRFLLLMFVLAIGWCVSPVVAVEYYVSPEGNDQWSGRLPAASPEGTDGPFRSLAKAAGAARAGDVCYLRAGTYRETLKPANSGEPGRPIVFRSYGEEVPVLSGADPLSDWQPEGERVFSAAMPWNLEDQNQLLAGPAMLTEARWPNNTGTLLQPVRAIATAGSPTSLTDPQLSGQPDSWTGGLLWCAGGSKWICWAGRVTGFDPQTKTLRFDARQAAGGWYTPKAGSEYVLIGARAALDAEGEWWYDRGRQRVLLIPPGGTAPAAGAIEAKRRLHTVDLSGRAHVHLIDLHLRAGGLLTDDRSRKLLLQGLRGRYLGHSYLRDVSDSGSVLIRGARHTVRECEFSCASGSVLRLEGREHRLINCYLHEGNYGAKWSGTVSLSGRRHLISHNTIRHSGRDLVSIHGLMESLVQHNDLSDAGWLTHDLGMTYGHNTDFMNTVIRYNLVHDNQAQGLAMGIYFDHLSHNAIVYRNALWNISGDALRINNPSYFNLVANNTCYNTNTGSRRPITSFDHSRRQDLFGTRWYNNLLNAPLQLPDSAITSHNLDLADPGYTDPAAGQFQLQATSPAAAAGKVLAGITVGEEPAAGAFFSRQPGGKAGEGRLGDPPPRAAWKAGHDFANPPDPEPVWEAADVDWMNLIVNSCWETGTLEGWTTTDAGRAEITAGNGWGNRFGSGEAVPTGTSKHELRLGGGVDGVEQRIGGLHPGTAYQLSGWLRVADAGETVQLGVRGHAAEPAAATTSSTGWTRLVVDFTTAADAREATVFVRKTSGGAGHAWCDNLGLPRSPAR